ARPGSYTRRSASLEISGAGLTLGWRHLLIPGDQIGRCRSSLFATLHVVVDYLFCAATCEVDRQLRVVNFGHGAITKLRMRDVIANCERTDVRNVACDCSWVRFRPHPYPRRLQTLIGSFGLF